MTIVDAIIKNLNRLKCYTIIIKIGIRIERNKRILKKNLYSRYIIIHNNIFLFKLSTHMRVNAIHIVFEKPTSAKSKKSSKNFPLC